MRSHLLWAAFAGILILKSNLSSCQDEIPKPKFPAAFQTEVQGIFRTEMAEVDASLYYDRVNNRAASFYTFRNESIKNIYDFNNNLFLSIQGNDCEVSKLTDDTKGSFFPFTEDQESKKLTLGTPEQTLYFTNSTLRLAPIGITTFPTLTYVGNVNIPAYRRINCNITHIFTAPVVKVPDCSDHKCQPTLVAIAVECPESEDKGQKYVNHEYAFFRFRAGISDESVFQPPPGIYCDIVNRVPFPELPEYFSFSYDLVEGITDANTGSGVFYDHRKVWYDSKLQLFRINEFEDGFLESFKIYDKYGGVMYDIDASLASCNSAPMVSKKIPFEELTRLPMILFQNNVADNNITYIGKREAHGLKYDVWSSTFETEVPGWKEVQEFYFTKMVTSMGEEGKLQLSHVDIYMYSLNDETDSYELKRNAYLIINNFRSEPKDWEAFDISACFKHEQRKGFRLNVTGPPVIKDSILYENLLEHMYMRIILATNVSLIRISKLAGVFDGTHMTEFTGWILESSDITDAESGKLESNMLNAYELLKTAASSGQLNIKLKRNGQEVEYVVGVIEETSSSEKPLSGGAIASIVLMSIISLCLICMGLCVVCKKTCPSMFQDDEDSKQIYPMK